MSDHEASPTRIAAQIASGIGFLGAGVILRDGLNIRGLNTAATLWCAAAAGAMAGSGFLVPAIAASLMILGTFIGTGAAGGRLAGVSAASESRSGGDG
jgi:putative Mg2+ transporter-C (MgtC) family protein